MGKRMRRSQRGEHSGSNTKYILGSIAAVLVIVAAIAVAAWVIYGKLNPSDQGRDADQKQTAVQQEEQKTEENEQADTEDTTEAAEENSRGTDAEIENILNGMTLEEKVCQLFMITPEALT